MKKWVIGDESQPSLYDLVSVCNHYGGMGGGHCEYKNIYLVQHDFISSCTTVNP